MINDSYISCCKYVYDRIEKQDITICNPQYKVKVAMMSALKARMELVRFRYSTKHLREDGTRYTKIKLAS